MVQRLLHMVPSDMALIPTIQLLYTIFEDLSRIAVIFLLDENDVPAPFLRRAGRDGGIFFKKTRKKT